MSIALHHLLAVHSGGQDGVDLAALRAAKALGIPTGGVMPKGFRAHSGEHPEYADLYGVTEHASPEWAPRTRANVEATDATLRLAEHMNSPGERCTENACRDVGRSCVSLHMTRKGDGFTLSRAEVDDAIATLRRLAVKLRRPLRLNVAGNSERTAPGIERSAEKVLRAMLPSIAAPLRVYTARVDYRGPDRLDVTAKSGGEEGRPFAPSWRILEPALAARKQADAAWKAGQHEQARLIDAAAFEIYEPLYVAEMQASYRVHRAAWDDLLAREVVTLVCYCAPRPWDAPGAPLKCHRRILAELLAKCGAVDCGELPRAGKGRG